MRLRLIALTLEEWGYSNKAHLRGLNLAHLYKEIVLLLILFHKFTAIGNLISNYCLNLYLINTAQVFIPVSAIS